MDALSSVDAIFAIYPDRLQDVLSWIDEEGPPNDLFVIFSGGDWDGTSPIRVIDIKNYANECFPIASIDVSEYL